MRPPQLRNAPYGTRDATKVCPVHKSACLLLTCYGKSLVERKAAAASVCAPRRASITHRCQVRTQGRSRAYAGGVWSLEGTCQALAIPRPHRRQLRQPLAAPSSQAANARHRRLRTQGTQPGKQVVQWQLPGRPSASARRVLSDPVPWTGAWNGSSRTPSTSSALCAITRGVSAGHAIAAPERTYGKEKFRGLRRW